MNELLKKLIGSGRKNNLHSVDELTLAAKNMGYSDQQIEEALGELGRISLDDAALEAVMGGTDTFTLDLNLSTHNVTHDTEKYNYSAETKQYEGIFNISIR